MNRSPSLEIIGILGDLALEGGAIASQKLAEICFAGHGGSRRAYAALLKRLEAKNIIRLDTSESKNPEDWVLSLTETGKKIHSPNSPTKAWEADWDGLWRLLTFDLPASDTLSRSRLRDWLKALRFGKVQGSVWINHRSLETIRQSFAQLSIPPDNILCMEGRFWNHHSDPQCVEKAWPLNRMQEAYAAYLRFLDRQAPQAPGLESYQAWKAQEQKLWDNALSLDPLLPRKSWPQSIRGPNPALEAEARREQAIRAWRDSTLHWA